MDVHGEMHTTKFSLVLLSTLWIYFHLYHTLLHTSPKIFKADGSAWAEQVTLQKTGLCCSSRLLALIS